MEWKNDEVMGDKSGDGDADEVRWAWKYGESGRFRSRRADEVNEGVDSRDEVMHSERNDW